MNKKDKINSITKKIIGAAIEIHRALGPGLLESAYEACMVFDLLEAGLKVEKQKPLPLVYKGVKLDCGYRLDLLVNNQVIVEIKTVDKLQPIHQAQLIAFLKLARKPVGLLINFNEKIRKNGFKRIAN